MLNNVYKPQKKRKFMTMGSSPVTTNTTTRKDVLQTLHTDAKHLQMWVICPYGGMGPDSTHLQLASSCQDVPRLPPKLVLYGFSLSRTRRGPHPNQPTRNSTATLPQQPAPRSTSSNDSALPARRRSLSTSVDQSVPNRPHGNNPSPSWLKFSSPFSTDTGV